MKHKKRLRIKDRIKWNIKSSRMFPKDFNITSLNKMIDVVLTITFLMRTRLLYRHIQGYFR